LTHRQLGERLHIAASAVSQALALLDLPGAVQERVEAGSLAPSVAYEISKVEDPQAQTELAARVVTEGLSRAETVQAVRRSAGAKPGLKSRGASKVRKVTSRVYRRMAGCTVTVENGRGLDPRTIAAALREALAAADAEEAALDQAVA
jgi:ParB family chromosome partitioning protein